MLYQESSLFTEKVFEEIGFIATIGLSHLFWGEMTNDSKRIEGANLIADSLSTFLKTHSVSGSPCYDGQSIDISLALLFLFLTNRVDSAKEWLRELSGRLAFGFRSQHWFPISTDSFDDLVDLEVNRNDIDIIKLMDASWLVPVLAQWMTVLDIEDAYAILVDLQKEVLKDTDFQLWYPDDKTDDYLYLGSAHIRKWHYRSTNNTSRYNRRNALDDEENPHRISC